MFSLTRLALPGLATLLLASLLLASPASAAVVQAINWGTATNISGDSDVATTGTLVTAVNFGLTGTVSGTTVNGVTFTAFGVSNGSASSAGPIAGVQIAESPGVLYSSNSLGYGSGSFDGLSSSYQTLLGSAVGGTLPVTVTVTLSGDGTNPLVVGRQYLLQLWVNTSDLSSLFYGASTQSIFNDYSLTPQTVTLNENVGNTAGNLGQWVTGTFTAASTTARFQINSTNNPNGVPQINALQLRDVTPSSVPETSSMVLLVAGSCGLMLAAGARRRRG
jgi:hypothetical protein